MSAESLSELKKQQSEIAKKISLIEKEAKEKRKEDFLANFYVKVVCNSCEGTGEITTGGADIISDPPENDTCDECGGNGYFNRRKWDGIKEYDMEFDDGDQR